MLFSMAGENLSRIELENESGWGMFLIIIIVLVIIFVARIVSEWWNR